MMITAVLFDPNGTLLPMDNGEFTIPHDRLINKQNRDISAYPQGGFEQLIGFVNTLSAKGYL